MNVDYNYSNDNDYSSNYSNRNSKHVISIFLIIILTFILGTGLFYLFNGNSFSLDKKKEPVSQQIFLNENTLYLEKGKSGKLEIVYPENADNKNYTWTSSNNNITVSDDGTVFAKEVGTTTVTVKSTDGQTVTCNVVVSEEEVKLEDIKLDTETLELEVGDIHEFGITTTPSDLNFDLQLNWTSSNVDVISVDDGIVKALSVGESTVTVTSSNDKEATCNITVKEKEILPDKISLSVNDIALIEGSKFKLETKFEPSEVTNVEIIWKSSDESVVTVSDSGELTALESGYAVITATTKNDKAASCIVIVKKSDNTPTEDEIVAESVSLNKTNVTLDLNESLKLEATIKPNNTTNQDLTWSSSNSSVVTVDNNGNVKGIANGNATITVETKNGKSATCKVNVIHIDVKTFDQRNEAVAYYSEAATKEIKKVVKNFKCDNKKNRCDIPKTYSTSLTGNIKIYIYDEKNKTKTYVKTVDKNYLPYNMKPNVIYYLESDTDSNKNEYIKLTGNIRMINIPGIKNVRDIGGKKADGGTVKHGYVYRGANPSYVSNIEAATNVFKDLGIGTVVDLRSSSDFRKVKKYYATLEKVNCVAGYFLGSKNIAGTRCGVETVMKSVVNGKGAYFHCAVGKHRTGTVAYLLEGILGVPLDERLDDYELSYFYGQSSNTIRTDSTIKQLYNKVNKYSGNTDQEKFINWFLSTSKNVESDIELINNFRKTMIDGTPTTYKVQNGKCVAIS